MSVRALRSWQRAAMQAYLDANPRDWLVTATPGAGKTTYALATARHLWDGGIIRRIVVVTPTDHLRNQWRAAAVRAEFRLDAVPNGERLPSDAHGAVVTYAQVAAQPALHRARAEGRATLVIFDEIHHAGDAMSWGTAAVDAFEPARRRLSITGTPFRSDQARIPHIRYDPAPDGEQVSVADFNYAYKEALADGVVRPVLFAAYSGVSRWENSAGAVLEATLGDHDLSRVSEQAAWRTALSPNGGWIPHVLAAADHRLDELRSGRMPDAGGLVLASNQEHARAYADVLLRLTGDKPVLVLSDEPDSSKRIESFTSDPGQRFLVAVRQVAEGVDIPRLAVGVYATSACTPLFFAQAVGRFVRSRRRGETATIFLPAVRALLTLAAKLEEERDHVLMPKHSATEAVSDFEERADGLEPTGAFTALEATAEFAHLLAGGAAHTGTAGLSEDDADFLGLPGLLTADQEATLLRSRDERARRAAKGSRRLTVDGDLIGSRAELARARQRNGQVGVGDPGSSSTGGAGHDRGRAPALTDPMLVRRELAAAVSERARHSGEAHADVYAELMRLVPGPRSADATVRTLRARLAALAQL